jgi:hypothetical protein
MSADYWRGYVTGALVLVLAHARLSPIVTTCGIVCIVVGTSIIRPRRAHRTPKADTPQGYHHTTNAKGPS